MKHLFLSTFVAVFSFMGLALRAQDDAATFDKLVQDDSDVVSVIALYDTEIRSALFVGAGSPELVTRVGDLQKSSHESFKKAISAYTKEEQSKIWNLTRFPSLVSQLQQSSSRESAALDRLLQDYPEDVRVDAREIATKHPEVLGSVDLIRRDFEQRSAQILAAYSEPTRQAFGLLMKNPEAMSTLNDNMRMCVVLGDLYKRNPDLVRSRFQDMNIALVNRKAKDLEEWKAKMENDPDAQSELKQSARDFAESQGYAPQEYSETQPVVVERYVNVSYPYWSGYPWWYETPCWTPYPYWYHWGFYYSSGRTMWYGTPSWYFLSWHFRHRPNFGMYPHITNCYFDYFNYGPRRYYARCSYVTHNWYRTNRTRLADDFRDDRSRRIERIRDLSTGGIGTQRSGTGSSGSGSTGTGTGGRRTTTDRPTSTYPNPDPDVRRERTPVRPNPNPTTNPAPEPTRRQPSVPVQPSPVPETKERPNTMPRNPVPSPAPREVPRSVPRVEQPRSNPQPSAGSGTVRSNDNVRPVVTPKPSQAPSKSERPSSHP